MKIAKTTTTTKSEADKHVGNEAEKVVYSPIKAA